MGVDTKPRPMLCSQHQLCKFRQPPASNIYCQFGIKLWRKVAGHIALIDSAMRPRRFRHVSTFSSQVIGVGAARSAQRA